MISVYVCIALLWLAFPLPSSPNYIFGNPNTRALRESFNKQRRKAALKLSNSRLESITLHTLPAGKELLNTTKQRSMARQKSLRP